MYFLEFVLEESGRFGLLLSKGSLECDQVFIWLDNPTNLDYPAQNYKC